MYVHVHKYILMYVCTYMNDVHVHVHTLSTNKQTLYFTCKYLYILQNIHSLKTKQILC